MIPLRQLLLDLPLKPNYSQAGFVETSCNWEAAQWIQRWPHWPMKMVAVYGEPGCGKTHLAHIWQEKTNARFLTPMDATALTPLDAIQGRQAFILDEVDTLFWQEEHLKDFYEGWMLNLYNLIQEKGADLLICSLQPPTQWNVKLPDLRSRLAAILSVAVTTPDENALKAVLLKLCSELGMSLSSEVADYILRRIERSFDRARIVAHTLNHYALSEHRALTLGLVREVLNEMDRTRQEFEKEDGKAQKI